MELCRRKLDALALYNPLTSKGFDFFQYIGHKHIYFHSYARYSLLAGLKALGLSSQARVMLPAFICRDVLAALHPLGYQALYYELDEQLQAAFDPETLPPAEVIVAVNYFGFPQRLEPFRKYAQKHGSILIEDNAHGFLSCDEQAVALGTRADLGIFSFRKTVPLPDGAALVINRPELIKQMPETLAFHQHFPGISFLLKSLMRSLAPVWGPRPSLYLTKGLRVWRKFRTGQEVPLGGKAAETQLPGNALPSQAINTHLPKLDIEAERQRRLRLYHLCHKLLKSQAVKPLIAQLPAHTCPMGYPFYCDPALRLKIESFLRQWGLESYPWPDLPEAIQEQGKEHYFLLRVIRFM